MRTKLEKRKEFSKSLYDECDSLGKQSGKKLLEENFKYTVIIPKEDYGADLILIDPKQPLWKMFGEVQIVRQWGNGKYPFKNFDLQKNKIDRLVEKYDDSIIFLAINNTGNRALLIETDNFLNCEVIHKVTSFSDFKLEAFYRMDLDNLECLTLPKKTSGLSTLQR